MANATGISTIVETSSTLPGLLRKKGRRVRTTSATTSSVSSDSTNQPVRNSSGVAWNRPRSDREREEVERRAQNAELDHEATDEPHVPAARAVR